MRHRSALSVAMAAVALAGCATSRPEARDDRVLVPAATYRMGTSAEDLPALRARFPDDAWPFYAPELPQHDETVAAFRIDRTPVTDDAFAAFLRVHPEWTRERVPPGSHNGKYLQDWQGSDPPAGAGRHPVTWITWQSAMAYCGWRGGRLPTEAEWELAAAPAGGGGDFPWGNAPATPARANYGAGGHGGPVDVASYPANDRGLFDMAGNVWEFMLEEWRDDYARPLVLPALPYDAVTTRRGLRGGSWDGSPVNLRVRYRDSHPPGGAGPHVGFRCVYPAG
jgi:formylglycine-generating enzyme required for sulfatase activity